MNVVKLNESQQMRIIEIKDLAKKALFLRRKADSLESKCKAVYQGVHIEIEQDLIDRGEEFSKIDIDFDSLTCTVFYPGDKKKVIETDDDALEIAKIIFENMSTDKIMEVVVHINNLLVQRREDESN